MKTLTTLRLIITATGLASAALAQPAPEPAPVAPPPAPPPAAPEVSAPAAPEPAAAPAPDEAAAAADPVATQAGPPLPQESAAAVPAAPAEPEAAPPPDRVKVAKQGYFKPGALIQAWYVFQERGEEDWTHGFRLRRTEVKASGELVPDLVAYKIMVDFAKVLEFESRSLDVDYGDDPDAGGSVSVQQPNRNVSALQDVEITFKSRYADVSMGQFKAPISYEGLKSSSALMLPERPAVTRRFGDFRDLGIRAEKQLGAFYYYAGVFNGAGLNRPDNDNDKGVALRLQVTPVKGVTLGAAGYGSVGSRDAANTKDIIEGDLIIEQGDLLAQAEYIRAFTGPDSGPWVDAHGFYAALGYKVLEKLQPVVRVGYLDPDAERNLGADDSEDEHWSVEGGLNYFISERNVMISALAGGLLFDEGGSDFDGVLALQLSY